MPTPTDLLGTVGSMMPGAAPFNFAEFIARLMQSKQPPKDQSSMTDVPKYNTTDVPMNVPPSGMPAPTPVQTTTIPAPTWNTTTNPAPRGVPPMQLGLPPQPSQSYYNLLSGGYGYDPYRTP